jgi:hypothetical protein
VAVRGLRRKSDARPFDLQSAREPKVNKATEEKAGGGSKFRDVDSEQRPIWPRHRQVLQGAK